MDKKSVLIVDDEADIREALEAYMDKEDFLVVTAKDGSEGLFKARNQEFDLIITDILMPKMNGVKLIRSIRDESIEKANGNREVPILVMSGNLSDFSSDLAVIDNLHTVDKPFSMEELENQIRFLSKQKEVVQIEGRDLFKLTYKNILRQVTETFSILCKNSPTVVSTRETDPGERVGHQFNLHNTFLINDRRAHILLSFPLSWAKSAALAILAEKGGSVNTDNNFEVIDLLNNAIMKKINKGFEHEGIGSIFVGSVTNFHKESRIQHQLKTDFQIVTALSTVFGEVEVHYFFSDTPLKKVA